MPHYQANSLPYPKTNLPRLKSINTTNTTVDIIRPNRISGFSLVELMVTIAVAAIILTVAVPSMSDFIVKLRIDNEISQINRMVLTARNTAVSTEQNVILCPLESGSCTNNWSNELTVFIDLDNSGTYLEASDTLVKIKEATSAGDSITYDGQSSVSYAPTGVLSSVASDFIYCPVADKSLARAVVVSVSGRSYPTTDSNNDGKDEYRTGANVSC